MMMIYDVFGRQIGVKRTLGKWCVFSVDESQGKRSRIWEIVIPDFLEEHEIAGWLDDMYHECASVMHPCVLRVR
jgi:hypothetical protein